MRHPSPIPACALALALAGACVPADGPPSPSAEAPAPTRASTRASSAAIDLVRARVTRIVDGDTIEVRAAIGLEPVRLIGVDTPERGTPGFGDATHFTARATAPGSTIWLETDVEERDRYGRLLAYVWLAPPRSGRAAEVRARMLNARLLLRGMAVLLTIPPNVAYVDTFTALQREARLDDLGLWARPPFVQRGCDPSYPDVCIAPPPPDLDCAQVTQRNFRVIGDDPHHFDENDDGRGCEG